MIKKWSWMKNTVGRCRHCIASSITRKDMTCTLRSVMQKNMAHIQYTVLCGYQSGTSSSPNGHANPKGIAVAIYSLWFIIWINLQEITNSKKRSATLDPKAFITLTFWQGLSWQPQSLDWVWDSEYSEDSNRRRFQQKEVPQSFCLDLLVCGFCHLCPCCSNHTVICSIRSYDIWL